MSNRTLNLNDNLYEYLLSHSLREPELLAALRHETSQLEMSNMQISPEQGQFMSLLVKILGVKRGIEVGVFTGYSSLAVAMAMPDEGELIVCDTSEVWTSIARQYWEKAGLSERIHLKIAPALATLDGLISEGQAGMFDFAFIDADKTNYINYYERCLQLIRPGGVIAIDNVLWDGAVADPADNSEDTLAIRELNDFIHDDQRVDVSMLPISDGLTLARRR
ncbi:MAG: class I SAM-dependent methyltransferase [Thioalkalispiraceae bacterium]|jgi:predicted O-methyltransferase YrrM